MAKEHESPEEYEQDTSANFADTASGSSSKSIILAVAGIIIIGVILVYLFFQGKLS